ncbi:purine-cytosine permease family protein [Pseudonocardia sp. Cha107L01]|uniref:purine-cytosine permease family protein n=1 Tax=Pseudonocardia sp. Cha107L01 TaxID=3457576 RepID=UPI00403EA735
MSSDVQLPDVAAAAAATAASRTTRSYNAAVANETLEDYSLRYAPRSFRRWSEFTVANTAIGGIAYLADFAIGASIAITHGAMNAIAAVLVAALVIFVTGIPIAYYSAKYSIDMDLLTRAAGFGYLGSTITSIVYASFTFIFFALEGSIMAQAFNVGFGLPLVIGYVVASLVIIPLVVFGMTLLSKLQVWTQPVWLVLMFAPFVYVGFKDPGKYAAFTHWGPQGGSGASFGWLGFGLGMGVALSLIAQIGEQVDYLRFMPIKTAHNAKRWWASVILAGPGWVILGAGKQLGGAFLAFLVSGAVGLTQAGEPIQEYIGGFGTFLSAGALGLAVFFVVLSQVKINVVNAYSGSLSWSNFFSRVLHYHPGRVVWIFFNVGIALTLMELGVFGFLNAVLGFYSNVAIAWMGALVADLVVNKPLGLSPPMVEFKRAHLFNFNPVGFGSMVIASVVSILAFFNVFGAYAQAFSPFLALAIAFVLSPVIAFATKGRYYIARADTLPEPLVVDGQLSTVLLECTVCVTEFERPDMASCPFHQGAVCSLCCSLDKQCHDMCKTTTRGGNGTRKVDISITPTPN